MDRLPIPTDLVGEKVYLRETKLSDCNDIYLGWLKDKEVIRFLETRFYKQTLNTIRDFVEKTNSSNDSYLCAIIDIERDKHIGNIKVGPIHPFYRRAEISYFIGDRTAWGKGCASEAVSLMTKFSFRDLNVHKLRGLVREFNFGSRKVLENNGYRLEGILKTEEKYEQDSEWEDVYSYAILDEEYLSDLKQEN